MYDETLDRNLISETWEAHAADLRRFATARVRDPSAADDLVQEAFLRLAQESRASRYPTQPRAWLFSVVRNLVISGARHTAVVRRQATAEPPVVATLESPEARFLAFERRQVLQVALAATVPDGQRGLLLAAQGYTGREIAEVLGRSVGATRTLLCRARKDVRRELVSRDSASLAG